ncbi:MAG TPA: hypothetical protein VHQ22_16045 [Terriglobales bacterium]|jgi:hypothetical protein|nr:hypothetical protein [Terriglobales bacterium]
MECAAVSGGDWRRSAAGTRRLPGFNDRKLHKIIRADYAEDDPHGKRELFAGGVVNDRWLAGR